MKKRIRIFEALVVAAAPLLVIYKKSWFLKMHVHNILGFFYDLKRKLGGRTAEYPVRTEIQCKNAPEPFTFKSYIGNNQNVHPKVLYFKEGFGGHRFWMSYTPFPWYIDCYENPCIAYSEDGFTWTNIEGNPIADAHGNGYYSDAHLVYREDTNAIECWYRYVGNYKKPPVDEVIFRRKSEDGIHWSEAEKLFGNYSGKYVHFLSPSVIWSDGAYDIWSVNKDNDFRIEYHRYTEDGTLTKIRDYQLEFRVEGSDTQYKPWHLDVIKENGKYILLVMCKELLGTGPRRWDLFISKSEDNIHYSVPELVLHGTKNGWDTQIYRSSMVNVDGQYRIYYSALNDIGKHGMGITVVDESGFSF